MDPARIKSAIRCETGQINVERAPVLEMVVVSLLTLTDVREGALDIDLGADLIDGSVAVRIDARAADRRSAASPMFYRALGFDDVKCSRTRTALHASARTVPYGSNFGNEVTLPG